MSDFLPGKAVAIGCGPYRTQTIQYPASRSARSRLIPDFAKSALHFEIVISAENEYNPARDWDSRRHYLTRAPCQGNWHSF